MLTPEKQPLKEYQSLECPWLIDAVQEKFDDALDMLDDNCVIYGGAVRDVLANLPIGGDLDIAVVRDALRSISSNFSNSVRWVQESNILPPSSPMRGSAHPTTAKKVISGVKTYLNDSGSSVQIIAAHSYTGMKVQGVDTGVLDIVTNVDIVACGVLSDLYGNILEIVPGAVKDCEERVLNFNYEIKATPTSIERLKERIEKFVKRGWKNNIDISNIKLVEGETTNPFDVFGGK